MATDTHDAGGNTQIDVLVGKPHGDHLHEEWWPLAQLATELAGSPNKTEPEQQVHVLVAVPHGDHTHEHWWSLGELVLQRTTISAGRVNPVPAVLVNIPHVDHAHESWLPLDQLFERIGHEV